MRRALVALSLCACSASTDPGVAAQLQIADAQYVPGAMPPNLGGPAVVAMNLSSYIVAPGAHDQPLLGTLDATATGVAFGLEGDRGYWVMPAGVPDTDSPTLPSFQTTMSFASDLTPGMVRLVGRAVDAAGSFGPPRELAITVEDVPVPTGKLVVSLRWAGSSDLDLHVVDPTGTEIWANQPNAYKPAPGKNYDPAAAAAAGALDLDSNAQCVLDGRDREDVIYPLVAPSGHYVVRVDAFSLCGDVVANWTVDALADGVSIGTASGTSVDADTMLPHQLGAGRTALEFDLP